MITKRTVKIGDERFLEFIDENTGNRIKQIALDETEYNRETVKVLIEGHMKENPDVGYGKALVAISAKYPELFSEYLGNNTDKSHSDEDTRKHNIAKKLIESHMGNNPGVSYGEALRVVSKEHSEFFI